jgi:hypothetical protein
MKNACVYVCLCLFLLQAKAERASQDAALLMHGCECSYNMVFHSVLIMKGDLQPWSQYEKQFVSELLPTAPMPGHSSNTQVGGHAPVREAASW